MYMLLLGLLLVSGGWLVARGIVRQRHWQTVLGTTMLVCTGLFFGLLNFWGEALWFWNIDYGRRFWKVVFTRYFLMLLIACISLVVVTVLTLRIPKSKNRKRWWPAVFAMLFGGTIGYGAWSTILVFFNREPAGISEPVLGRDAGFYLFSLPFYDLAQRWLFILGLIALATALTAVFLRRRDTDVEVVLPGEPQALKPLHVPLSFLLLVFAWGQYLDRFHLMTSSLGVVTGPGWTDVHVRMPGYMVTGIAAVVAAVALLIPPLRKRFYNLGERLFRRSEAATLFAPLLPVAIIAAIAAIFLLAAPLLLQWLRVVPNEITMERDYIAHNIAMTHHGFGMEDIEEREFPAAEEITRETIENNRDLMSEIRLWDWRALSQVYEQFQEIRLYYSFSDVDIDRYKIGDDYRQVMVSPREMDIGSLSFDSQTFVNKRFKYTHGYGLAMSSVREFTEEGLPNLLIRDIPPKSSHPSLRITHPQIYFGELTYTPVVVNSEEKEFDYPSGDANVYSRYEGSGGVQLSNFWRKFVYGWMFDGTRFLLSGYPREESRILFHRQISDRVRRIAPFLQFENDPYVVLDEGRIYWIIDAYTTSDRFPYSEPYTSPHGGPATAFHGKNYVRNSVKAVVDAYNGDVDFYIFDDKDPIIKVWSNVFPSMFKPAHDMPEGLREHVRYPASYLLVQSLVYTKYHMTDPAVFYNQEDLWVRATEKYYQGVRPVEPYYVMWKIPGSEDLQFSLILPFTPKNKQVLIGWMAGLCDGENYGRLLAYKFPKDKRILGPQQVETKIDQDRHLSGQLTLWDQRGSKVIRGNVLAIPIDRTLMYVEPIYLQADTAAYPELRIVAVMHNDNLSYGNTFEEAIDGLFEEDGDSAPTWTEGPGVGPATGRDALLRQASDAFENYLRLQGEKRFSDAAQELEKLSRTLEQLNAEGSP